MDNILISLVFMVIAGLSIDLLAYFIIRAEWKKSGVVLTDKLLDQAGSKLDQLTQAGRKLFSPIKLQPAPRPAFAQPQPAAPSQAPAVEIIPASVETVGGLRRVNFSLDMQMNTTMEVRIGATSEAGVKVEKREI